MYILSSSIQHLLHYRARKNQKRTALQLLALSGVVRPGHEELRYAIPTVSRTAFRGEARTRGGHTTDRSS